MTVQEFIDWCNANLTDAQKEYDMYFNSGDINLREVDCEYFRVSDKQEIVVL